MATGTTGMNGWLKWVITVPLLLVAGWALAQVDTSRVEKINRNSDSIATVEARVDSLEAAKVRAEYDREELRKLSHQSVNLMKVIASEMNVPKSKVQEALIIPPDTGDSN